MLGFGRGAGLLLGVDRYFPDKKDSHLLCETTSLRPRAVRPPSSSLHHAQPTTQHITSHKSPKTQATTTTTMASSKAITTTHASNQSIEELEKSIDATLAQYRSSFSSPPPSSVSRKANDDDALSSHAYYSRLETFRTETYFAKPLCLSPLNCSAFG